MRRYDPAGNRTQFRRLRAYYIASNVSRSYVTTEAKGFEPLIRVTPYTDVPGLRVQPLRHASRVVPLGTDPSVQPYKSRVFTITLRDYTGQLGIEPSPKVLETCWLP